MELNEYLRVSSGKDHRTFHCARVARLCMMMVDVPQTMDAKRQMSAITVGDLSKAVRRPLQTMPPIHHFFYFVLLFLLILFLLSVYQKTTLYLTPVFFYLSFI